MNNIVKKIGIAALTASMILGVAALAACGDNKEHTHAPKKVAAVAASDGADGKTEHYACECGKLFADEGAKTEISAKDVTVHYWDNGVNSADNTNKIYTCKNCKETKTEEIEDDAYVFEAEYTKIKGIEGVGWSGDIWGLNMIKPDEGLSGASNGYYIVGLYKNGLKLTFNFESDAEVHDATLILRVSGEMVENINLTWEEYQVKVNGTPVEYPGISITGIDLDSEVKHAFQDVVVTTTLSLVKGANTIELVTNNGIKMGGTATATAPMVDCIKIKTSAELTWDPILRNLD